MLEIRDKLTSVKGIGDVSAKRFAKMGITNVGTLITHYPFRYENYAMPIAISNLKVGQLVSVEGIVSSTPKVFNKSKLSIIDCVIRDDTGSLQVKWFNAPYIISTVKFGARLIFRGKVESKAGRFFISHPEVFTKDQYRELMRSLRPVYPSTEGLGQAVIRKSINQVFTELVLKEYLPKSVVDKYELPSFRESLYNVHFPQDEKTLGKALNRLVFDEFFSFLGNMKTLKSTEQVRPNEKPIKRDSRVDEIIVSLGYELTEDQLTTLDEIFDDISGPSVMQRLLQGDVGSGKTVVALLILACAVFSGYQGCIMAPTEVLAKQHFEYFRQMLSPYGIEVVALVGSMGKREKTVNYEAIKSGKAGIVVGTHAAVEDVVEFNNLGLVVIDEQHRFGVKQREALELKGGNPHLLLMSATPIPRTYALMLYGDMAISTLKTMPKSRKPIKNCVADESMRGTVNKFIIKEVAAGHQAYIICPLIEESDKLEAAAVTEYVETIREVLPENIRIAALTGKMKGSEKNEIMDSFKNGDIDVLVSTTVIEVGINVPNATVMVIENAERFGLAALHQIRGRVGRGADQSYCIFMSSKDTETAKKRLDIVAHSNDGFYIAGQDMKLRGPGDFFGVRQSGEEQFVLADPSRDMDILDAAKASVEALSIDELKEVLSRRSAIISSMEYMVY